jgi:hypothetical protein
MLEAIEQMSTCRDLRNESLAYVRSGIPAREGSVPQLQWTRKDTALSSAGFF